MHAQLNKPCDHRKVSERYVTTGQAAAAIGVSLSTLTRWVHKGWIKPALRTPGGHYRWDLADLRRQLDALPAEEEKT